MDNASILNAAAQFYNNTPHASFDSVAADVAEATGWDIDVAAQALDDHLDTLVPDQAPR